MRGRGRLPKSCSPRGQPWRPRASQPSNLVGWKRRPREMSHDIQALAMQGYKSRPIRLRGNPHFGVTPWRPRGPRGRSRGMRPPWTGSGTMLNSMIRWVAWYP